MNKCLLIEDNKIAQRFPAMILQKAGWEVDVVDTGHAALLAVKNNEYHLIITDIGLPDIDGHELSKMIREITYNESLPIIGLSAHADLTIEKNGAINKIYYKPFTKEMLSQIVDAFFKPDYYIQQADLIKLKR